MHTYCRDYELLKSQELEISSQWYNTTGISFQARPDLTVSVVRITKNKEAKGGSLKAKEAGEAKGCYSCFPCFLDDY